MLKKPLSLLLALMMLVSCLPHIVLAENIVIENILDMTDVATVRNGKAHCDNVQANSQIVSDYTGNNRRFGFVKFDLADYKDDIDNIAEVKFSFIPYTPVSDINVEILPDALEDWSSASLTYTSAENAGMVDTDSPGILCTVDGLVNGTRAYTADLSSAVKEHLKNNPSNTVVCFKLHSTQGKLTVINGVGAKPPQLSVKLEVDVDNLVLKNYNDLTFDKISSESKDAVTSNLKLITTGTYGTTISWESKTPYIDAESGIIRRPRKGEGDKRVSLFATIENTGVSLTKEFQITLKESNIYSDDLVLEQNCYAADSTYVRYYQGVVNNGDIVCDPSYGNHRMGFVKFDFTGLEDYLARANSMKLRIDTKTDANVANKSDFVAYLLPQELEDIDTATLTYAIAKDAGLVGYTDNLLFRQKDVAKVTTYYSDDILAAIKKNIDEGGDSIVWLKFATTTGVGYTINGAIAGEATKPALIIKYPKPATELDSRTLTIDKTVNSNMTLPTKGEYGSEIAWSSSDTSLISASSGQVRVDTADEDYSKEDSVANLTATFTADGVSVTKDFAVRVRRNGVYDATQSATITSDASVSDSPTLSVGGTVGRITLLSFDVSGDLAAIQGRRKTVLKLYGSEEYNNKNLTVVPVTDALVLSDGIGSISYDAALTITNESNAYKLSDNFEDGSYITFDITEYIHSLSGGKAIFALCTTDPQIILESQSGVLGKEPKLIVSPYEYTDEYAAQVAADDIDFADLSSESMDFVRNDLTLPTNGRFGSIITWHSSDEKVVASDGTVTRGAQSIDVTLTATVTVGLSTASKAFTFNVRKAETDLEYAQSLADALAPELTILTSSITLKGENLPDGAVATWASSEPYEAKVNGFNLEISRPNSADLPVVLTVSVSFNGAVAQKSFNATVVRSASKNLLRNRGIVSGDASAQKAIDEDITTIWEISDSSVTIDLNSSRVISGMTIVPEKASFTGLAISISEDTYQWKSVYNGGSFESGKLNYITFDPVAYGRYVKFDFPSSAKAISFIGAYNFADESADDVFSQVTVPAEASADFSLVTTLQGNAVTWTSSSNAIVVSGSVAKVTRGTNGANVTLTASVTINNETQTKSYVVYVPAKERTQGGGSSSGGGTMIASPVPAPQAPSGSSNKTFADITEAPWAADYITYLTDKGIVNGKSADRFAPNDNLKREEMAKIIAIAFGLAETADVSFADVKPQDWYASYVSSLYARGITKGMGDGSFGIGLDITRQDAFTMIAKVLGLDTSSADATGFGDDGKIADYARGSINSLMALGIVGGDNNGNVNPTAKITRAEIAKVICLAIGNK